MFICTYMSGDIKAKKTTHFISNNKKLIDLHVTYFP